MDERHTERLVHCMVITMTFQQPDFPPILSFSCCFVGHHELPPGSASLTPHSWKHKLGSCLSEHISSSPRVPKDPHDIVVQIIQVILQTRGNWQEQKQHQSDYKLLKETWCSGCLVIQNRKKMAKGKQYLLPQWSLYDLARRYCIASSLTVS